MTGTIEGVRTLLVPVTDLAASRAMYEALLGGPPQTDSEYYVGFDAAGQHIGLLPGGGPQGMTSPVPCWHVTDSEERLARMTAAGGVVREPVHEVGGGRRVATVADPNGNVVGLIQDQ